MKRDKKTLLAIIARALGWPAARDKLASVSLESLAILVASLRRLRNSP